MHRIARSASLIIRLTLLAAIASTATLAACNTTEGVGRDVQSVGRGVEEAAQDAKD